MLAPAVALHDLIAVGDVMLDVLVDAPPGEEAPVHAPVTVRPGGSAANAAIAAARSGARVLLVGRIGDDSAGGVLREALARAGVETRLAVDRGLPTGSVVYSLPAGQAVAERGANRALAPDDVGDLRGGVILVSGYALLQEGSSEAAAAALRGTAQLRAVDVASPGLARGALELLASTRSNAILADEEELAALGDPFDDLASRFRLVVEKRGARGAVAALDGSREEALPPSVAPGAQPGTGDVFGGVLLAQLARGATLRTALTAACAAGAEHAAAPL